MRNLGKVFIILTLVLGMTNFSQVNSAASSSEVTKEAEYEPIGVDLTLQSGDQKNDLWDVIIESKVELQEKSDEDVKLEYKLYKVSDNGKANMESVEDKEIFKKKLKVKKLEKSPIELKKLPIGQYKLNVQALSKVSESMTLGGNEMLLFTVTDEGIKEGWDESLVNYTPAVNEKGEKKEIHVDPSSEDYGKKKDDVSISEKDLKYTMSSTSSMSGYWKMYDRDSNTTGVKYAKVELLYRDQFYIWRTAGTDYTTSSGYFNISFNYPSESNLWELRVWSINEDGKVENDSGGNFYVYDQWLSMGSGDNQVGNLYVPNGNSGNEVGRAFWVYDDLAKTESRLSIWKDPGYSTIVWYAGSEENAHYKRGGKIYLHDNSADSPTTAIHELAHNYMYNIYNGDYPPTDCSRGHTYNGESEPGCAWTEGWAHFLALYMNNDSTYTYTSGSTWDAEDTSSFPEGDSCEGRVAGALWDVYDTEDDGLDTRSYFFSYIYKAMYSGVNDTFEDWWNQWKALGYDVNAKYSIHQNSISYD